MNTNDMALFSLYVYGVLIDEENKSNKPKLPPGWSLAEPLHKDDLLGFSYGVFRNATGEVVLSFTGTNEGIDWISNAIAGAGLVPAPQLVAAAKAYCDVKAAYGGNITLSGHSLGGGLASVVATWFDRPAVVFDAAPFQLSAQSPSAWAATGSALGYAGYSAPEFSRALLDFSIREQKVAHHYMDGEALLFLRASLPVVAGSETPISVGGLGLDPVQLHSMALYTAAKMSTSFAQATFSSQRILPLVMKEDFYGFNTGSSAERNFLIDLIRGEQSGNGKLTHFASDLQKLGTNIAGLNQAAQDALIAQGIEWYYWQPTNYSGKEFFASSGSLLQYTPNNKNEDSRNKGANKAFTYVSKWLDPIIQAEGGYSVNYDYEQWNVAAGNSSSGTALNGTKTQLFIGGSGSDNFTGGNAADLLLGGAGTDNLNGGGGDDKLYGGAGSDVLKGGIGFDTYKADNQDTITDIDGSGSVQLGATTLGVAERKKGETDYKDRAGNIYVRDDNGLVINGGLRILDWKDGDLGITLVDKDIDKIKEKVKSAESIPSPIALDLNGDGVVGTTAVGTGTHFDHEGDGFAEVRAANNMWFATDRTYEKNYRNRSYFRPYLLVEKTNQNLQITNNSSHQACTIFRRSKTITPIPVAARARAYWAMTQFSSEKILKNTHSALPEKDIDHLVKESNVLHVILDYILCQ